MKQKSFILIAIFGILIFGLGFGFSETAMGQGSIPSDIPANISPYIPANIVSGTTTVCTFNNTKKGNLQIVKNATGIPPTGILSKFYYSIMPTPSVLLVVPNKKYNDSDENEYYGKNRMTLDPGKYRILETVPLDFNWVMKSVACTILPQCGDELCDSNSGEDCSNCLIDCGCGSKSLCLTTGTLSQCVDSTPCGDGICNLSLGDRENCNACPRDCFTGCSPPPPFLPIVPTGTPIIGKYGIEDVNVVIGKTTRCTFENELITLKIVSQAIGGDETDTFDYNIRRYDYASPSAISDGLSVTVNGKIREDEIRGDEYIGSNGKYLKPAVTSYVITQEIPKGWALNSVVCTLQGGKGTGVPTIYNYGINNVTIQPDGITTCTFKNTKKGELKIVKKATGATGGEKFDYNFKFVSTRYLPPVRLLSSLQPTKATIQVDENGLGSFLFTNFVAVADSGTGNRVMTSLDGIKWTTRTSATDNNWKSVTYGRGLFVAVSDSGTGNRIMTSPDGINWTIRESPKHAGNYVDNNWKSVTYGNGLFVAVADSGTGKRVMTSDDGINWTIRTSAIDKNWKSVTYGKGLFVAVADGGTDNRIMTSDDGINWTTRKSPKDTNNIIINNDWKSVAHGKGLFVAVASSGTGNRVMTSPDGIKWTIRKSSDDNDWKSVTYGKGLFVAVSDISVMISPDGIKWTTITGAPVNDWKSVTYGKGLFVAVSQSGSDNRVMTSPNGTTWTTRTSSADNNWTSVTDSDTGLYPGTYQITENLPKNITEDDDKKSWEWTIKKVSCTLENGDSTGGSIVRGIGNFDIIAGKTTTCTFENVLTDPQSSGGSSKVGTGEPPKPNGQ